VKPGSVYDLTAARAHAFPALYPGLGVLIPVKHPAAPNPM
jgi:hypothetical protein